MLWERFGISAHDALHAHSYVWINNLLDEWRAEQVAAEREDLMRRHEEKLRGHSGGQD